MNDITEAEVFKNNGSSAMTKTKFSAKRWMQRCKAQQHCTVEQCKCVQWSDESLCLEVRQASLGLFGSTCRAAM